MGQNLSWAFMHLHVVIDPFSNPSKDSDSCVVCSYVVFGLSYRERHDNRLLDKVPEELYISSIKFSAGATKPFVAIQQAGDGNYGCSLIDITVPQADRRLRYLIPVCGFSTCVADSSLDFRHPFDLPSATSNISQLRGL